MKHILTIVFLVISISAFAQEEIDVSERSEIKVNALYLILGGFELDNEYILNEESSVGISATVFFDDDVEYLWGVTPHYRLFFGNQPALGFFAEGHASIFGYDDYRVNFNGNGFTVSENKRTLAGVGIAIGGKFKTKRSVVVEVVGGFGRVFGDDATGVYPRFGINIGKRF